MKTSLNGVRSIAQPVAKSVDLRPKETEKNQKKKKKHQRQHTAGAHSTRDQPETFMLYLTQMFKSSMARWKQARALTVYSMNLQGKRKGRNGANVNHDVVNK